MPTRRHTARSARRLGAALLWSLLFGASQGQAGSDAIIPLFAEGRVADFFADATYDPNVPTPESVLGFPLGSRPVRYDEAITYLTALADASPRVAIVPTGQTHEGRILYYVIISSAENLANRERIRGDVAQLTRPGSDGVIADRDRIVSTSPVISYLSYSIHGDELSGVDASLWVAYHLAAATDLTTQRIRDGVITLIDPSQNPDGRERYLAQIFAFNGYVPSSNADDLQHHGFWPWGRSNHYLFDLNRDWLPLAHPETHAQVRTILEWNPQVMVDAHEMGAYSTFLFSPGREPINQNVTSEIKRWWEVFGADQGAAFDRRGWSYYTGDWHEEWYPGYGSSWSLFLGAVGILYEQAGADGSSVKRPDKSYHTYPRAVAQQAVSSLTNLETAANNRRELLSDYADFHSKGATGSHPGLRGAFVLAPGTNTGREHRFLNTVRSHGLTVRRATAPFSLRVRNPQGTVVSREYPAGTHLVPLKQPRGLLAKALLEFDLHLKPEFLEEERREIEKGNGTRLYGVSGWSLALAYDLDISYAPSAPSVASESVEIVADPSPGRVNHLEARFGYLLPPDDDRSVNALVRMFDAGLSVRACEKPFVHNDVAYDAGTLLLRRSENPEGISETLRTIAEETGVTITGTSSNYSSSGPDLGSDHFRLLEAPRVGLFIGSGIDFTSCGPLWFLLDYDLRMRQSLLDIDGLQFTDLSVYNVLIFPNYWGGASGLKSRIGNGGVQQLRTWVEAGGTLIAIGNSAYFCTDSSVGLSAARERSEVLEKLDDYERDYREYKAAWSATVDTNAVWKGGPAPSREDGEKKPADTDALKRADRWARRFQPRGVIMSLELNPEHWLSFGAGDHASAMFYSNDALMAKAPVEIPARMESADRMRLSGLLWPEARARWAHSAYATREGTGRGQVILFADDPYFRAYFHGTKRLFLNAVLLGPGLGADHPAPW